MELRDKWAMCFWSGLSARYGQDGYNDLDAVVESYRLADHAVGIRGAELPPLTHPTSDSEQPPAGDNSAYAVTKLPQTAFDLLDDLDKIFSVPVEHNARMDGVRQIIREWRSAKAAIA